MPVTVTEKFDSREFSQNDQDPSQDYARLTYVIKGSADQDDIYDALTGVGGAPSTFEGLARGAINPRPLYVDSTVGASARCVWEAVVTYTRKQAREDDSNVVQFVWAPKSRIVYCAASEVATYAAGGFSIPAMGGWINVDYENGQPIVRGVQWPQAPDHVVRVSYYVPNAKVTTAYLNNLRTLTSGNGSTNVSPFTLYPRSGIPMTYARGELFIQQITASTQGNTRWQFDIDFGASMTASNFSVGGVTVTTKQGWDYYWVLSKVAPDATTKRLKRTTLGVYVDRIATERDFSVLSV